MPLNKLQKILTILLSEAILLNGAIIFENVNYKLNESNPFDGCNISTSSFCANYKALRAESSLKSLEFKDILDMLKNSDIDAKKAYVIWDGIMHNENLTEEDLENLKGYVQYFIDNKDINYEYVYDRLSTVKWEIDPNSENYATYNREKNKITFASDDARKQSIGHEFGHAEDYGSNILDSAGVNYTWFREGLNSVLNYEYNNENDDGKDIKAFFIRCLCELIDSEILLDVRATGNMDILIDALKQKGLNENQIQNLFNLIDECNKIYFDEKDESQRYWETKFKLIKSLFEAYNIVYDTPEEVSSIYGFYLKFIYNYPGNGFEAGANITLNLYYFNSEKKEEQKSFKSEIYDEKEGQYLSPDGNSETIDYVYNKRTSIFNFSGNETKQTRYRNDKEYEVIRNITTQKSMNYWFNDIKNRLIINRQIAEDSQQKSR